MQASNWQSRLDVILSCWFLTVTITLIYCCIAALWQGRVYRFLETRTWLDKNREDKEKSLPRQLLVVTQPCVISNPPILLHNIAVWKLSLSWSNISKILAFSQAFALHCVTRMAIVAWYNSMQKKLYWTRLIVPNPSKIEKKNSNFHLLIIQSEVQQEEGTMLMTFCYWII